MQYINGEYYNGGTNFVIQNVSCDTRIFKLQPELNICNKELLSNLYLFYMTPEHSGCLY